MVFIIWNLSVADENHGDRFLDFVTVKKGLEDGSLLLIDVRNPKERAESGFTLYNDILRIARNLMETRENIQIESHPFHHIICD